MTDDPTLEPIDPFAPPYVGPFDREPWPRRLTAHVVSPGAEPRLHGYDVTGDLARHYDMSAVVWLALRGELPTEHERAAFDTALVLLAPTHVGQAPGHAAYLSRLIGAAPVSSVAIAAVGLGELARTERQAMAPWLAWLERDPGDAGEVPACALTAEPVAEGLESSSAVEAIEARAWLDAKMLEWFGERGALPARPLHRIACAYAILHRLGWRAELAFELLLVWARMPAVLAEASFARPGAVRDYPARLPDYRYVDDEGTSP